MSTEELLKMLAENGYNVSKDGENITITTKTEIEDGDICTSKCGKIFIFDGKYYDDKYYDDMFIRAYCYLDTCYTYRPVVNTSLILKSGYRLATYEEKQKLFDALAEKGKQWNAEKKCIEPYKYQPKDKELVWCWNNYEMRILRFYDKKNKCTFNSNGNRNGLAYDHYAPFVEYPMSKHFKEALPKLED